jgi:hypothetical protein
MPVTYRKPVRPTPAIRRRMAHLARALGCYGVARWARIKAPGMLSAKPRFRPLRLQLRMRRKHAPDWRHSYLSPPASLKFDSRWRRLNAKTAIAMRRIGYTKKA